MFRFRTAATALALLAAASAFPARSTAAPVHEQHSPVVGDPQSQVDVAVRKVLQAYLDALKAGDYSRATSFFSKAANVNADNFKDANSLSDWFFISSELISSTPTTAHVQLNFTVKVAPGTNTGYTNGRNVRFVHLVLEHGEWKIRSITTAP